MSIEMIDPADWHNANIVQIDVKASSNMEAITELDDWATQNGFARTNDYWLRHIIINGETYFRGICYRLTPVELESRRKQMRRTQARADKIEAALQAAEA